MTNELKSKFNLDINQAADSANGLPNAKGKMARAGGNPSIVSLWISKNGSGALTGTALPLDVKTALAAKAANTQEVELENGVKLGLGRIVLFDNDKGDNPARADYYGYSFTSDGVNQHSVWAYVDKETGAMSLRGTTEVYVPKSEREAKAEAAAAPAPQVPATAKAKVKQALTAKR